MHVAILLFQGDITWRIGPTDPLAYNPGAFPGVRFVSPLLSYALKHLMHSRERNPPDPFIGFIDDECLFITNILAFAIDDSIVDRYRIEDDLAVRLTSRATPVLSVAIPFLAALRYFSKQVRIRANEDTLCAWEWVEIELFPVSVPIRRRSGSFQLVIANRVVDTAATRSHIDTACACPPDFRPPVFDGLLLDAIEAWADYDYRKSVLYAAMSVETAFGTILDERYEQCVKPSNDPRWRTIELPQAGGVTIRKDPVLEALRRRDDLGSLIHETALYVLGRSLLVENEALFREAKRVYATRNKIAHRGEPPPVASDEHLQLDADGAARSLDCAVQLLSWLGVKEEYILPRPGFQNVASTASKAWHIEQ